jgi:hypothetical protein
VSPVKYELGFYIPEDDILHSTAVKPQILHTLSVKSPPQVLSGTTGGPLGAVPKVSTQGSALARGRPMSRSEIRAEAS